MNEDEARNPVTGMTHAQLAAWVRETRRSQGLPEFIKDQETVDRVVALMTARGWPPPWASQPDDLDAEAPALSAATGKQDMAA